MRGGAPILLFAVVLAACARGPMQPQSLNPVPKRVPLATGLTLSVVDLGDSQSTDVIVLLPGLSDSWRSYEAVLPHLPGSVRTIAVSQRGHGDSDKPAAGYTVGDYAEDIVALLDALALRRAVLVGHSSASLVARRVAIAHPDRVAALVLEGSFIAVDPEVAQKAAPKFSALVDPLSREFVRDFAASTFVRPVAPAFIEAMVDESLKAPARVWRETFAGVLAYDDAKELASLRVPTKIVWGDRDSITDRRTIDALVRALPSCKLVVHEGVGHTPHWESPERFARDVLAAKTP
jgi:non-heme chloroperoxidase